MARGLAGRVAGWFRSIPDPTVSGRIALTFLALAFLFAVLLGQNQVLFVTCAVWMTVLASAVLTAAATGRLSLERKLPERVFAGAPFPVRLRVRNESRWRPALGLGFLDALQVSEPGGITRGPALDVLPPQAEAEVRYVKRIHRRGVYNVVNTLAATRFPFGIFERRVLMQSPARLVVLPALGVLRAAARRDLSRRKAVPHAVRRSREGRDEFHSLREFRDGENPRHIHWRTSARALKLMRRVLRDEAAEDLVFLLDTSVEGIDGEIRQRHFERAVSCAATLLAESAARGRRARVHWVGGSAGHAGTRAGLVPALEALATVETSRTGTKQLVETTTLHQGATVVLLSLSGPATEACRAAAARGVQLRTWDVAHPSFERYFRRR